MYILFLNYYKKSKNNSTNMFKFLWYLLWSIFIILWIWLSSIRLFFAGLITLPIIKQYIKKYIKIEHFNVYNTIIVVILIFVWITYYAINNTPKHDVIVKWLSHDSVTIDDKNKVLWFSNLFESFDTMPIKVQTVVKNKVQTHNYRNWSYDSTEIYLRSWTIYTRVYFTDSIKQHFWFFFKTPINENTKLTDSDAKEYYNVKNCINMGYSCDEIQ